MLESLGEDTVLLRQGSDLDREFDRLVLPGGESTTQAKLLYEQGMLEPLRAYIATGMPVLATCAGLILLAEEIEDEDPPDATRARTFPARVRRNAYGRQLGSFHARLPFKGVGEVPATFIRAPQFVSLGEGAEELARVDDVVVAARSGNQIACAFHPELDTDTAIHELFLSL